VGLRSSPEQGFVLGRAVFACVGGTGLARGCRQPLVPQKSPWRSSSAIAVRGGEKQKKMKDLAVANGKSVTGLGLLFLFIPVP